MENVFNTGRKYRYDPMCAPDAYDTQHLPIESENEISGGGSNFPSNS